MKTSAFNEEGTGKLSQLSYISAVGLRFLGLSHLLPK